MEINKETKIPEIKGGIADSHFHNLNYTQQGTEPRNLIEAMNLQDMRYAVLAPIPTSLLLRCGNCSHDHDHGHHTKSEVKTDTIKKFWSNYNPAEGLPAAAQEHIESIIPNYYISELKVRNAFSATAEEYKKLIKKDGPLYYDTNVDAHTAASYKNLPVEVQDRFDPMITGLALGDMRASEKLIMKLRDNPGVFTGIGEITVFKEWVQHKVQAGLQADMSEQQRALIKLMKTCGTIGMPVILHCDVNDYRPDDKGVNQASEANNKDRPVYLDAILEFLRHQDCQGTTIIWAHACGLGKYSRALPSHLDNIKSLLEDTRLNHVKIDLSWDTVAEQLLFTDQQLKDKAKEPDNEKLSALADLINKHPTRFLFGSDSLSPNSVDIWQKTSTIYSPLFRKLSDKARQNFRIGNYIENIRNARFKVRLWEILCMPYAAIAITRRTDNELPRAAKIAISIAIKEAIKKGKEQINHILSGPEISGSDNSEKDHENFSKLRSTLLQYAKAYSETVKYPADDLEKWATYIFKDKSKTAPWTDNNEFLKLIDEVEKEWGAEGEALEALKAQISQNKETYPERYMNLPSDRNSALIAVDRAIRDAIVHRMMQVELQLQINMKLTPSTEQISDFELKSTDLSRIWVDIAQNGNQYDPQNHAPLAAYMDQVQAEITKASVKAC